MGELFECEHIIPFILQIDLRLLYHISQKKSHSLAFDSRIYYDMPMNIEADTTAQATHPTLIMVRGIPGGGKSYVAARLREAIGEEQVVVLDPDAIDKTSEEYKSLSEALTRDEVNEKLHPYRFLRSSAHIAITNNKTVIWNQGFIDLDGFNKTVVNLTAHATEQGKQLPTLVVEVEINGDTAKQRVAKRAAQGGHNVPEEAFERFIGQYRSFANEGYNTVTVNGQDDVSTSVATIMRALEKL
jgi:predicted ABC-type ATPase